MQRTEARILLLLGAGALIFALAASTVSAAFRRSSTAAAVRTSSTAEAAIEERLPDLDQEVPSELAVRVGTANGRRVYELGFRSAVVNVGAGPLLVKGARPDRKTSEMVVNQLIERADAPRRVVRAVGRMKYVISNGHQHWHYLEFDRYELLRYELRPADAGSSSPRAIVSDRKTGFCLGDRYRTTGDTRARPPALPAFRGRCGLHRPDLLRMTEGISVGYGDDYSGFLEGQQLSLDGLPNGRYVLVHQVNRDRRLRELSYSNNAASLLLDLQWHNGAPSLDIIARCPDTDQCDRTMPAPESALVMTPLAEIRPAPWRGPWRLVVAVCCVLAAALTPTHTNDALADAAAPVIPNDWTQLQWNFDGPYGVSAPQAWGNLVAANAPGGAGVTVAVLDTGIAYPGSGSSRPASPDLRRTLFVPGYDFVDNDTIPFDTTGHGTHVASTIAEYTNNRFGLTGLAYGAQLMPVRVLDSHGSGDVTAIAKGLRFAASHGAQVINMSFSFPRNVRSDELKPILRAIKYAHARGSVIVAGVGNQGARTIAYPAKFPHVVAVGATTEHGCLGRYSNHGSGIDVVAPGGGRDAAFAKDRHCVADRRGRPIYQITLRPPNRRFAIRGFIGTSMAAPHVSAIAALIIASGVIGRHPSPDAIEARLERTARDLGASGYDRGYGWGLVNAASATRPGNHFTRDRLHDHSG